MLKTSIVSIAQPPILGVQYRRTLYNVDTSILYTRSYFLFIYYNIVDFISIMTSSLCSNEIAIGRNITITRWHHISDRVLHEIFCFLFFFSKKYHFQA